MKAESAVRRPRRLPAVALLIGLIACLLDQSMQPAGTSSAKPSTPGEALQPVAYVLASTPLTDDDNGAALLNVQDLVPADPVSNCITVAGSSAAPGKVMFGASAVSGTLAAHLNLGIEIGVGGGFGNCSSFVGSSFYRGTLAALAAQTSAATGVETPWNGESGTSRTFRITVEVADSDAAQSSASGADLVWTLLSTPTPQPPSTATPPLTPTPTSTGTPTPTSTETTPPPPPVTPTPAPTSTETPTPTATSAPTSTIPPAPRPTAASPVAGSAPSAGESFTGPSNPAVRRPSSAADIAPAPEDPQTGPSDEGHHDDPDGEAAEPTPSGDASGSVATTAPPGPSSSEPAKQPTAVATPPRREDLESPSLLEAALSRIEEVAASLAHFAWGVAKRSGFPIVLLILVGLFLAIQDRLDRKDPKLALAPLHDEPHLRFPPPAASERTDQSKGRS